MDYFLLLEVVSKCIDMGYKGVAITDHNGCQAFPIAYSTVTAYNKGKEEKDKFKVIYGTEITMTLTSYKEKYEKIIQNYNLIDDSKIIDENVVINV